MKLAHIREGAEQSVKQHLENVAKYCSIYASKIGLSACGELTGWLHDMGKLTEAFDSYIRESFETHKRNGPVIDHSTAGAVWIVEKITSDAKPMEQLTAQLIAIVVMSHHGGLIDIYDDRGESPYIRRINKLKTDISWQKQYNEAKEELNQVVAEHYLDRLFKEAVQEVTKIFEQIRGFVRQKNKDNQVKSNQDEMRYMLGVLCKYLYSALIDADRYDTATFMDNQQMHKPEDKTLVWTELSQRLERKIALYPQDTKINQLRSYISCTCYQNAVKRSGIYTLNCPTGSGKTMASLRFALNHAKYYKKERIFYIIPFITITEQNTREIKKILSAYEDDKWLEKMILELHSAKEEESDNTEDWIEDMELISERLAHPMIFTTMVRFLNVFFASGTRNIRGLHQFSNSVIIFDEIQTLPPKCIALFNGVLNFLTQIAGATVVLATATQPLLNQTPDEIPSIYLEKESELSGCTKEIYEQFKRTEIIDATVVGGNTKEQISKMIWECVERNGDVLTILNTKNAVKELYEEVNRCRLESGKEDVLIYVLSTNLYPNHRKQKLDEIRRNLGYRKMIVISTQLIEAGVDISFKNVIRSLAGLDSITQAAGRCNRHDELKEGLGKVYLVNPNFEDLSKLQDIQKAKEVMAMLLELYKKSPESFEGQLDSQKAITHYFKGYHSKQKECMAYPFKTKHNRQHRMYELLAKNAQNTLDALNHLGTDGQYLAVTQSYKTAAKYFEAIESHGKAVIVSHGDSLILIGQLLAETTCEMKYESLRQLQAYTVNLSEGLLKQLGEAIVYKPLLGVYILKEGYYDETFGVTSTPTSTVFYHF